MTEVEWNACTDPAPMLEFLLSNGKAIDRKLRLFACACCRRVWHLLIDKGAQHAVETAELFADRLVGDAQRSSARKAAQRAAQSRAVTATPRAPKWERRAASTVYYAAARDAREAAWNAPQLAVEALVWRAGGYASRAVEAVTQSERSAQAGILRDLSGPLLYRAIPMSPSILAWNGGAIVQLARSIYEERRFADLPVLGDALEEAGCTSPDLLRHCRQQGEAHVRGCWLLDLLLHKEGGESHDRG